MIYYKEDGTPWLNGEYKPITAQEIWEDKLGSIVQKEGQQQRGGNAPTGSKVGDIITVGEGDNATSKLVLDKNAFSTKYEFNQVVEKSLKAKGIPVGSKEGNALQDAAYAEYGVKDLELN